LVYPYVVYAEDGFYLALSDTLVHLPGEFTLSYRDKDYSFTFSVGEVRGTLVKTPLEEMEFGGVIIADSIEPQEPVDATIEAEAKLGEALELMTDEGVRRLLVEERGEIVGIVILKDLMRGRRACSRVCWLLSK